MKIAMLLSGGVDSSVALHLLKEEGHDVTAFYLKIWLQEEFMALGDCPWEEDLKYARSVCEQLDVPLQVLPLQTEYWDIIIDYTINEVKAGRTPNPDVFCNNRIKFGAFLDKIDSGYDKIASGHYARVSWADGVYKLSRCPDPVKDQTYFLSFLSQEQLSRTLFPLGPYTKADVRELATQFGLATQNRRDSQGLCFLGQIKFSEFIEEHLGLLPGQIIDLDSGDVMGEHKGYYYYTIGQRQGLGLSGGPWYVVGKDVAQNIVYIANSTKMLDKHRNAFRANSFHWISGSAPGTENLQVKIRHGAKIFDCTLSSSADGTRTVTLTEGDQGIAPGQIAVFYDEMVCLGAGAILD